MLPNLFGSANTLGMTRRAAVMSAGLGDRLQKTRELAECTARELDRLAETAEGHASLIESGVVKNVTVETAAALAKVLGVSLDWLITGDGKSPSERAVRAAVEMARRERAKSSAA
jgi:transcriptional regulator with XRE-family HTH domain